MADRCGFEIDLRATRERCATWLATEYGYIHDDPPVEDVEAFDDLPREDGRWRCPRAAEDRCVLHDPTSTDREIREAIEAALRGEHDSDDFAVDAGDGDYRVLATRFLGVDLDTLDLRGWQHPTTGGAAIDLRCAEIGSLQFEDASLTGGIRIDGAAVGDVDGANADLGGSFGARFATVESGLSLEQAEIDGRVDCRFVDLGGDASLEHAAAESRFDFGFSHVDGTVDAAGGDCGGRFTLKEAVVDAVTAPGVSVAGPDPESDIPGLQFRGLTSAGSVDIRDADCAGQLIGYRMTVGGDVDAAEARITQGVSLGTRTGTRLGEAAIEGSLSLADAEVGEACKLLGRDRPGATLSVGGRVDLSGATFADLRVAPELAHDRLSVIDCRGTTVESGLLAQPAGADPVIYDLERAELGPVDVEPGAATVPESLWLNRTTFAGFTFVGAARRQFERADWALIDDDAERQETVAFARAFGDATEYARDVAALLAARPATRTWLQETESPDGAAALAAHVFDGVGDQTVERVARNGPENPEQLGKPPFERERYRVGVATLLARELRPLEEDGGSAGEESVAETLVAGAGEEIRALAEEWEDGGERTDDRLAALRDAFADALADPENVARSLEERELTYIAARKGADDVGDSSTAGNLFVNELRVRRAIHRREGDYGKAAANLIFDWVSGYGERPKRAFVASVATIGLFAFVYWPLWHLLPGFSSQTYAGFDGAVLLSSASFTAFVLGGASVEPKLLRFLANFEALLGAFMIALFVFTLTRSLHR